MNLLERQNYDIRFIRFQEKIRSTEVENRLEEAITKIYPGKHGHYLHFTRQVKKGVYISAMVKRETLKAWSTGGTGFFGSSNIFGFSRQRVAIPSLLLPHILKKIAPQNHREIVIWWKGAGELIQFNGEGNPISSIWIEKPPAHRVSWVFVSSPERFRRKNFTTDFPSIPADDLLFNKPISPKGGRVTHINEKRIPRKKLLSNLVFFLFSILLASYRYTSYQHYEISDLKERVILNQAYEDESDKINESISILNDEISLAFKNDLASGHPYDLLAALHSTSTPLLTVKRFDLLGHTFSLEGDSTAPILCSRNLMKNTCFSEINILDISQSESKYSFTLRGVYNE
ncbi:MAG: hypothetical protein JEY99_20590 [Spirochaetales bacterium]|nr:hypothetical protein [Spirochaetales bacterium]